MKGLELAEQYYQTYGESMIHRLFPEYEDKIAIGLVGSGSECYGFDDEISTDHDFEPGFCLFIPNESIIDSRSAFALERAYSKLPSEFMGHKRLKIQPVGGARHGVIRISDFYCDKIGYPNAEIDLYSWFRIPEYALSEATNGKIFRDDLGQFSDIRHQLTSMPDAVRYKKMAGHLLLMGQAGQYNYGRCLSHNEPAAAQLAIYEFAKHTMHLLFLLNQKYMPFYKWSFRAARNLPLLSNLATDVEFLITQPNPPHLQRQKQQIVEHIATAIASHLPAQADTVELESLAYAVNEKISDIGIRNEHILFAI